jgi:hypothetical protein
MPAEIRHSCRIRLRRSANRGGLGRMNRGSTLVASVRGGVGHASRCTRRPMSPDAVDTDVFFAEFDGRKYAFALSDAEAREAAETSWAFGDPSDPESGRVGDHWASDRNDSGWRIAKRRLLVIPVAAEFRGVEGETCHVGWECPICCQQPYSDDVEHDEIGPLLTVCGRTRFHADGEEVWDIPGVGSLF